MIYWLLVHAWGSMRLRHAGVYRLLQAGAGAELAQVRRRLLVAEGRPRAGQDRRTSLTSSRRTSWPRGAGPSRWQADNPRALRGRRRSPARKSERDELRARADSWVSSDRSSPGARSRPSSQTSYPRRVPALPAPARGPSRRGRHPDPGPDALQLRERRRTRPHAAALGHSLQDVHLRRDRPGRPLPGLREDDGVPARRRDERVPRGVALLSRRDRRPRHRFARSHVAANGPWSVASSV